MADIWRPVVKINRNQIEDFAKELSKMGAGQSFARMQRAAAFLEAEVQREIRSSGMVLDRSAHRRKPGTTKIINSLRARVDGTPNRFPVRLVLEPKPGVSHVKVASLEKGTRGHHIDTPVLFPRNNRFSAAGKMIGKPQPSARQRNAYSKNNKTTARGVDVKSRKGYHFMERAMRSTVAAIRAGRV